MARVRSSTLAVVVAHVVLLLLAGAPGVQAQDASPAAGRAWVGITPDLAAMPVTPADLEAIGLPGFGRFFNGFFNDLDMFIEGTAGFYGQPVEETRAVFDGMGLRRMYGSGMGQPSVPGEESPPVRGAYANLIEIENAAEADAFFDYIAAAGSEPAAQFVAVEAPFSLGDRATIVNYASFDPEAGERYFEYSLIFRVGDLYVDTGLWTIVPEGSATPAATAVTADAALSSPAGTMAELEAIGRRQLERIDAVLAGGSPDLPSLLLRLGDDPLAATADYTEGYRLLEGEVLPYYADSDDDIIADPAALTGADAAYELEELFSRGEEPAPGDYYFLNRLYAFPDEGAAAAFLASRPDALASGGFALVSDAAPEAREDLLPGEATDLGDESLAFSFVRAFDDGTQASGFEVFVRVGDVVSAVSLEGPPDMPLAQVTEIAAAQAACLEAGACPAALPVPKALLAAPAAATPAA